MPNVIEPASPGPAAPGSAKDARPSVLLVHERYRQRAGEDAVFDAELDLLRRMGHDVEALVVDNAAIPDDPGPSQRLRLGLETVWSARAARTIRDSLRDRAVDIVHVHNTFPLLSPSIYGAARASGAAVVQTIHNYRPICPAATLFRDGRPCEDCVGRSVPWPSIVHACYRDSRLQTIPVAALVASQRLFRTWRNVDAIIALTEFAAAKLVEGGLPAGRMEVKANFIAPDPGPRTGVGDGFLFVGRLVPEKGIGTVIEAAPLLGPGITVRLVGDGPDAPRLVDAARRHEALQPLGRLDRRAVQSEMARCRALVFPSIWYEGLPMTILEAFATGVPVIAARLGAAATLVRDRESGLTYEPGDAAGLAACLAWAQAHPDEMAAFGRAARELYLSRYTAEASYRRLIEIYQAALARASRRGEAARPRSAA